MDKSKTKLTVLDQITDADKVRKKIIDVASELYAKKGFNATSIQEISEAAGVSLPVTYHYVKKKSEIMRMIMEDVLHMFHDNLLDMIQGIDDPEEKLAIATRLYFRVVDQQREKALLIYQKSNSLDRASKGRVMQLEVEVSNIFCEMIKEGITPPSVYDILKIVRIIGLLPSLEGIQNVNILCFMINFKDRTASKWMEIHGNQRGLK